MKMCSRCRKAKPLDQFHASRNKPDGKQPYCKVCLTENSKRDYRENERKQVCTERANKKRKECQTIANNIKGERGCCCCGEKTVCCLDFHHFGDDKDKDVSTWALNKSVKRMLEEIEKCVVVCSNCHRKIHAGLIVLGPMNELRILDSVAQLAAQETLNFEVVGSTPTGVTERLKALDELTELDQELGFY